MREIAETLVIDDNRTPVTNEPFLQQQPALTYGDNMVHLPWLSHVLASGAVKWGSLSLSRTAFDYAE